MKSPEKEQGTINITESQRRVLKFWNCKFSPSPTPASLHPAPQSRVPLSGSLRWSLESSNLCFNQPSRWFWCVLTLLAEYQLYTGMFKYVLSWTEWITVQRTSALEPSLTLRSLVLPSGKKKVVRTIERSWCFLWSLMTIPSFIFQRYLHLHLSEKLN